MDETNEQKLPDFTVKPNHETKLKELLRNLTSIESQLYHDSAKEFIKLIKSDSGHEFVQAYVQTSSKLVEITQAWEFRKGKLGFSLILTLVSAILRHWKCNNNDNDSGGGGGGDGIGRALDKFARGLVEEKMGDLYKELSSKEAKRQNPALSLLAAIVLRGPHLAWEVAKVFDFKLGGFPKLAEVRLRAAKKGEEGRKRGHSTRKAFVRFAMAFLEVGSPRLLRGVLQRKEMYSGVLRGLGNDDEETVVYVLSILRDRVLVAESLVPPGLRSVLFGSVTLEQLVGVSGRSDFGGAAELAHGVLVVVCTDPANGLMPDPQRRLRGNTKRLLDLMKKLKAAEVEYHKELLLAVMKGCPSFGSAYLDEFPYSLEDLVSHNWFGAISLAADVVSSVNDGLSFGFVDTPPAFHSQYVQDILKCIGPRAFPKSVMNKGLQHSDSLVKHGTLKFVLEALKLLDYLVKTVDNFIFSSDKEIRYSWEALKVEIQNCVALLFPDPNLILKLLSPLKSDFKSLESTPKRKAETEVASEHHVNVIKKLKSSNEDLDIVITGVDSSEVDLSGDVAAAAAADSDSDEQLVTETNIMKCIRDLWGCSMDEDLKDEDTYFLSKTLDTLRHYHRTMPIAMEGFDLFKFLPNNPLALPRMLQQPLLQLLTEHVSQFSGDVTPTRSPPQMYKHLYPFILLLMFSPAKEIRQQAYVLAKAAMLSSGAFDNNPKEICLWFLFIPGYSTTHHFGDLEVEIFHKLSSVVVSFLCDAVSTIGNNLYKYMELLKHYICDSEGGKYLSPEVSPFIICVLEKCLRLLSSLSGSFTLPQKSLISLYVCNTIKHLLDTQVNAGPLSFLIDRLLSEKLENLNSKVDVMELNECPCEWRPTKSLLRFARDILYQRHYSNYPDVMGATQSTNSFLRTLCDIKEVLRSEYDIGLTGLTVGFSFSLMCTRHTEILQNFPSVLFLSNNLLEVPFTVLLNVFFLEPNHLASISKLWPEMFFTGLDSANHSKERKEEIFHKIDLDSMEAASVAFALYLKRIPFCVLFSSVVHSCSLDLFEQPALQKLLLIKLTELPSDHMIPSLCNVLFWINHANSSYRVTSLDELETLSGLCFVLGEHLLKQLLVEHKDTVSQADVKASLPLHYAVEVAEIMFNHPAVTASLSWPLSSDQEVPDSVFGETLEVLIEVAKQGIHRMDHHVVDLLRTVSELLFPLFENQISEQVIKGRKRVLRAFKGLVDKLFVVFKNKFDACVQSSDFKPLIPSFYTLHNLIHFISPLELLELVNWLFARIDFSNTAYHLSPKEDAVFVGLHLASCTFDFLSAYMRQSYGESNLYSFSSGADETQFDIPLFEKVFIKVLGCRSKLDIADTCLLKAIKVVSMNKVVQHHLPSMMVLSRVCEGIPVDIFSYCLERINRTKAELLYLTVQMSPLHMSAFGFMFLEILDKSLSSSVNGTLETCTSSFSDEELVMLLPTVFLYLNSSVSKFGGQLCKPYRRIIMVYGRVLLSGFSNWKTFVSGDMFETGINESLPASTEDFLNLFSNSLLGKAILMVRDHLAVSEDIMTPERRLSIFNCIYPTATDDDIFDNCGETGLYSLKHPLEFVNRVVAKINFCRMLLVSEDKDNEDKKVFSPEITSDIEKAKIRFIRMLINSWISIAKNFPENLDYSGNVDGGISLFRFLEVFIMNNIVELTTEMHDGLIKLKYLPFIEQFVKSFLLYRFGDPWTLKMLRLVLSSLCHGKFSCTSVLQLLLAHSQFAKFIHTVCQSLVSTQLGLVFTPMQSILKSFVAPRSDLETLDSKNKKLTSQQLNLLELVKLVRVLVHTYTQQRKVDVGDVDINFRELIYLLLSSYGATCSEVDKEIYNLMLEIESIDNSSAGTVAQMDYLWGIASLKVGKHWEQEKEMLSVDSKDTDACEERRKIKFRENIPVDPKLCAQTVLYFPYSRIVNIETFPKHKLDSSTVIHEPRPTTADGLQLYDPVFIFRFSIHCLSMNYIEPVEFASLGLLAIAFMSISSPDRDMRKLGYGVLELFKSTLENCQMKKDVRRLLLLLTYLQNGIVEPWQRIPSIISVFVAEASLVLLDSSHDNYSTISKYLMKSSGANMKAIPLFQECFWSSSITFKADRLWMLRMLCVALNTEDDAQIYTGNSIFQILLSFYSSPFADNDSKELIVQIVRKAVQFHKAVRFLVEHCGLILWLSSIVSSTYWSECSDLKKFTFTQLPIILEVVNYITMPISIVEWLQNHAMEQLSELSSHLFKLLVGGVELLKERTIICNSILQILTLVLKISQKRKIYQPHFTLSGEGLFQLCEAVEVCSKSRCNPSMVLGLEAVLMSTPPATILLMDQEKLLKFLRWAVTTAIQSESTKVLQTEDPLVSKLLRWLTASVILGKISSKLSKLDLGGSMGNPKFQNLLSLLDCHEKGFGENPGNGCEDVLAASIFYLLQQLGFSHKLLPSAVSALCLLLFPGSSDLEFVDGLGISVQSLCSEICCPAEANPAWRWSYYQPWRDLNAEELNDVKNLDEIHACERLLVVASNILLKRSHCSHFLALKDVQNLHVYDWERSLLQSE